MTRTAGGGEHFADRLLRGAPPVLGILLRPAGVGHPKRLMLRRGFGNDVPLFVHQNGARAACAHIHTEKHGVSSFVRVQNKCSKEGEESGDFYREPRRDTRAAGGTRFRRSPNSTTLAFFDCRARRTI